MDDKLPKKIKLDIWDTAGDPALASYTQNFFHGADAMIIVYSIDSPSSFKSVSNYVEAMERICSSNTIKVFVANKCDLDNKRRVKMEDLADKA